MILQRLLERVRVRRITGTASSEIRGITYDSRSVGQGFLFVAVRGFSVDGHMYIQEAVDRGAAAIIGEDAVDRITANEFTAQHKTAYVEVSDSREALALVSAAFYGHPSERLSLIGITGTNGKTTTSYITKNIVEAGGGRAGLIGTICYMTGERTDAAMNTTPESLDLQRYLRDMLVNRMDYAVIEVSSHALSLKRVEGCHFRVAAFTNISRDHLDYHGTMDDYFTAKSRIFRYLDAGGSAVLNGDDPMIRRLVRDLDCSIITCGLEEGAMIRADNIRYGGCANASSGISFEVQTPESRFAVTSGLMGRFNVYNILMSVGIAYALGMSEEAITGGITNARSVAGRFEKIDEGQHFLCIVDYAHTDDALKNIIEAVKPVTGGRVITVFGCGGDRDRTKRPIMGRVATEGSDFVIITSDNPRSEDPAEIIRDIEQGIEKENYAIQIEREGAIAEAVAMAKEGDTVLIAGKGHEDYQEIGGVRHHFSDKEILRTEIRKKIKNQK